MSSKELANELTELKEEMEEKLELMRDLVREAPSHIRNSAEAYWLPHIQMALSNDHDYLGGSMCNVQDTITKLEEDEPEEEEDHANA